LLAMNTDWRIIMCFIFLPVVIYGLLIANENFPVNERVKAGVKYLDMLKEVGILGALVIVSLCVFEIGNLFSFGLALKIILIVTIVGLFGYYVRAWGKGLFFLLLLAMIPLATME